MISFEEWLTEVSILIERYQKLTDDIDFNLLDNGDLEQLGYVILEHEVNNQFIHKGSVTESEPKIRIRKINTDIAYDVFNLSESWRRFPIPESYVCYRRTIHAILDFYNQQLESPSIVKAKSIIQAMKDKAHD